MKWNAAQALTWVTRREPLDLGSWTPEILPPIEGAQQQLAKAIGADQIRAWGRPERTRTRADRDGPTEQIPSSIFRNTRQIVDFTGDIATRPHTECYYGPRWLAIEFDEDEIKRAFPKPPPPDATNWMLDEGQRLQAEGRKGKRADMVKDCMKATCCTKRAAEAAHGMLPQEFRRPRGKSPRTAG
jgi:hypothetical protein